MSATGIVPPEAITVPPACTTAPATCAALPRPSEPTFGVEPVGKFQLSLTTTAAFVVPPTDDPHTDIPSFVGVKDATSIFCNTKSPNPVSALPLSANVERLPYKFV